MFDRITYPVGKIRRNLDAQANSRGWIGSQNGNDFIRKLDKTIFTVAGGISAVPKKDLALVAVDGCRMDNIFNRRLSLSRVNHLVIRKGSQQRPRSATLALAYGISGSRWCCSASDGISASSAPQISSQNATGRRSAIKFKPSTIF
jgi:hypothetical protein